MSTSIWDVEFCDNAELYQCRRSELDAELDRIDQLIARRRAESLNRLAVNAAKARAWRVVRRHT